MIANIAFIFRSLVMVLFIDRFIELRMEVSATQLCGNMHKLNRTKRRLYEHLCVDIFLWKVLTLVKHFPTHRGVHVQSIKIRTTHWILGKDLSSGQRCPPFHTTGPKRFVCVVIFVLSAYFLYLWPSSGCRSSDKGEGGGGGGDWSHKKFFSALRASVWSINKDPGSWIRHCNLHR